MKPEAVASPCARLRTTISGVVSFPRTSAICRLRAGSTPAQRLAALRSSSVLRVAIDAIDQLLNVVGETKVRSGRPR
jgi:hypothetical protein